MAALLGSITHVSAQVALTGVSYTENFDSIGTALPTGWTTRTGATASTFGTAAALTIAKTSWSSTTGAYANFASADGLVSTDTGTTQNASTDRSLGLRQTGSFGDPGASFNFNFDSTDFEVSAISFKAQMLSVQTRSTTWTVQFGLGSSPTSWTTITTFSDPGVFGSTTINITDGVVLAALSDQSSVVFRVVALSASTGSGSRDTFGIDDFTMTHSAISSVPEPSSTALLAGGLVLGAVVVQRRRKAVSTQV